jgi:low temperature requirement protein LtrA
VPSATATISRADDPGRLARISYTYLHLPIVAGVIVAAVADELVLAHPEGHAETAGKAAILGGPALYVLGNALSKGTITRRLPLSHLAGLMLLALLAPFASAWSPLFLSASTSAILVIVAVWEQASLAQPAPGSP